jgi:hypothetical protein
MLGYKTSGCHDVEHLGFFNCGKCTAPRNRGQRMLSTAFTAAGTVHSVHNLIKSFAGAQASQEIVNWNSNTVFSFGTRGYRDLICQLACEHSDDWWHLWAWLQVFQGTIPGHSNVCSGGFFGCKSWTALESPARRTLVGSQHRLVRLNLRAVSQSSCTILLSVQTRIGRTCQTPRLTVRFSTHIPPSSHVALAMMMMMMMMMMV